jgi:hypothetical protein
VRLNRTGSILQTLDPQAFLGNSIRPVYIKRQLRRMMNSESGIPLDDESPRTNSDLDNFHTCIMNTEPPVTHRASLGTLSYFSVPPRIDNTKYALFGAILRLTSPSGPCLFYFIIFIILIYARASRTAVFPLIPVRQHTKRDPATRKPLFLTLIGA